MTAGPDHWRHVLARGACNLRDLGGYETADGRRVRRGTVFRSGVLDRLDAQNAQLAGLNIVAVVDFRTGHERVSRPSNLPPAWQAKVWTRDYENSGGDHTQMPLDLDADVVRGIMHRVYRRMPFEQADAYRALFNRLADAEVPLLFHCLGGKDRTGVAAALLLDLLGVPIDTIRYDYALTEYCLARDSAAMDSFDAHLPADVQERRKPLMRADPAYLDSMFAKLSKEFGTVERYLDERLGIDQHAQDRIRSLLLEPSRHRHRQP